MRDAPRNAALLLAPFILAVPFAVAPLLQASGSGALKLYAGLGVGAAGRRAAGGPLLLRHQPGRAVRARAAAPSSCRGSRRPAPSWRLAGGAVRGPEPDAGQRHRLRHEQVLPGDVDRGRPAGRVADPALAGPAIAAGAAASASPRRCWSSAWTAFNREQVLDWNEVEAANWIAANTPERAVFATDGWLNSPTDAAGRLRLITFTPYIANLGFDPDSAREEVRTIYCTGDMRDTAAMMRQLGATYLLDSGRPSRLRHAHRLRGGPGAAQGLRERRRSASGS